MVDRSYSLGSLQPVGTTWGIHLDGMKERISGSQDGEFEELFEGTQGRQCEMISSATSSVPRSLLPRLLSQPLGPFLCLGSVSRRDGLPSSSMSPTQKRAYSDSPETQQREEQTASPRNSHQESSGQLEDAERPTSSSSSSIDELIVSTRSPQVVPARRR